MRLFLKILLIFNFTWAIGLKALLVPQKAHSVALSGAGIAEFIDPSITPAALSKVDRYMGISSNKWFIDLKGNKSTWIFGIDTKRLFSIESIGIDDIEYRETNETESLGYVGAKWIAFDFGSAINLNKLLNRYSDFHIGYNLKLNYSKLHTVRYWGYSFDIGIINSINERLNFGFLIKNLGKEFSGSRTDNIDLYYGLGLGYKINVIQNKNFFTTTNILFDIVKSNDIPIYKVGLKASVPYVNFMLAKSYSSKDRYEDFAYGFSINIKDWEIVFGSIRHKNENIGCPSSIEIKKFFK